MTDGTSIPLKIGTDEQFAAARDLLKRCNYAEKAVCERCGAKSIYESEKTAVKRLNQTVPADALDVAIHLFIDGSLVEQSVLLKFFSYEELGLLYILGLLLQDPTRPNLCYCPVTLVPVSNCLVASDRSWNTDGTDVPPSVDAVYPAAIPNTAHFLEYMPRHKCESFLDLCAGSGIAALVAARDFATRAYAVDITERSRVFAEFNAHLSGLANVNSVRGDLYEPVNDLTFDVIVAHPPYVPVLKPKWIFHDGGQDGEEIVRRIIQGVPGHLNPGGWLFIRAMGSDRNEGPFEQRIRKWLGDDGEEFDVALIARNPVDPAVFVVRSLLKGSTQPEELGQWKTLFESLGVKELVPASIFIRRRTSPRPVYTIRRLQKENTDKADIDRLLSWEQAAVDGSGISRILDTPLTAAKGIELQVRNFLHDGDWTAVEYTLLTDHPFSMECSTQPWLAHILSKCDGKKTGRDHFRELVEQGVIFHETPAEDFADALGVLVSGGFLRLGAS